MSYASAALPFRTRCLAGRDDNLVVSDTGDYLFLSGRDLATLEAVPDALDLELRARLRSKFILVDQGAQPGLDRLRRSRIAARHEVTTRGPALHIIVPTLQCAHSCKYCQVSRSLEATRFTMTAEALDAACDTVLQSSANQMTVEFQGGDPLLRFDLIERAVERICASPELNGRKVRFVVASTLHQLTDGMCEFMALHDMVLSTSIDGPAELHNRNRPIPTRDSYERTLAGIELARRWLGHDKVSALMTTTRGSLEHPDAIVDEYVKLGFSEIFLRPLSAYGFAKRNQQHLGYSLEDFQRFYVRAFERVLGWNARGVALREVYASIILNKLLSPFDAGYVDLQSPCASGRGVLVYNYDGFVYPSDEARMVLESGDASWRMGRIGEPLDELLQSDAARVIASTGDPRSAEGCKDCVYRPFCAPNPIDAKAQHGRPDVSPALTEHCQRHLWLFDHFVSRVDAAGPEQLDMFHRWAGTAGATA